MTSALPQKSVQPDVSASFSYVPEWSSEFLSLFPHRYDYIQAPLTQPGDRPQWHTESRHPLSDRLLHQGGSLFGVRFGPETRYCLLDIDITSPYHPQQDSLALPRLLASLEPLGLTTPLICTSSYSEGLHIYFPFRKSQRSWKLASAVATLLTVGGFKIRPGQLELFPNTKQYIAQGSPSLFNAHRLPLQEPGSKLLNDALEPRWSSPEQFVTLWQRCQNRNEISALKIQTVLKQHRRKRYFVSEKADKFLNDLNAEIEPGWTGKGQTNHLLGRITMRCFIFHHVLAGGIPLSGQALIDEIIATAKSLPGYKTWCRHQHELVKRANDWARCIENSHYFPYGSQQGKYKAANTRQNATKLKTAPTPSEEGSKNWNQEQAIQAQDKIRQLVRELRNTQNLPNTITKRFQVLTKAGIGGSSLYRYKHLWHPKFESSSSKRSEPLSEKCPPARPEGAANWHIPTSLLSANGRKHNQGRDSNEEKEPQIETTGRNSPSAVASGVASTPDKNSIIGRIREELAEVNRQKAWMDPLDGNSFTTQQEQEDAKQAKQQVFIQQLVGYLASGEYILVNEALDVLSQRPEFLTSEAVSEVLEEGRGICEASSQNLVEPFESSECLLAIFRALLRLQWSPQQIIDELQQRFGVQAISQLSAEQLSHWLEHLHQHINTPDASS